MNADWFAGRLRELREGKSWTQQQLADQAGLKIGGVRDLEQGRVKPTWETVLALCVPLEVTPDAFIQEPGTISEPKKRGRPPGKKKEGNSK